jgi:putative endonuclease
MKPRRYYMYIMASLSGTLYVGVTNNIFTRTTQHKAGEGSEFTSRYAVDRLIYYESFQYVGNAIAREKEIKGWRRAKKIALIQSTNPHWRDLSRDFGKQFQPPKDRVSG